MRLWSLHPSHLDQKGLVAVWREGLLAFHVLAGKTKGYRNHPQLLRFKNHHTPLEAIAHYLHTIVDEAEKRGYKFARGKLPQLTSVQKISVTTGQLIYETKHLLDRLKVRDVERFEKLRSNNKLDLHPLFDEEPGEVEIWEKI